ncbi:POSSIBLE TRANSMEMBRANE PROTEIN [uncultured Candidatus Thioglobus sp.]|nr:POSSIBLE TRANSMEMBRANE PROTEIN [uncultured Candidatus Thioglobus sp.]
MSDNTKYPVQLSIEYSDKSNRVTVFFRLVMVIPIYIVLALLGGFDIGGDLSFIIGGGMLFLAPLLLILFRQKYPKWWFDWGLQIRQFGCRASSYLMLLTDKYPSVDEDQDVDLQFEYPDAKNDLNRYLALVKWLLVMPHILLTILCVIVLMCLSPIIWLLVLIMGKMPRQLFDILTGFLRYTARVDAYAFFLITDKYPPFSLKP